MAWTLGAAVNHTSENAPKGQRHVSPGQREAAPAAERRPGFRSSPGAGEPIGDHRNGTPTSLNQSAPRHARLAAASFTSRLNGSRLARPPVLAGWVPGAALRLPRAVMWLALRADDPVSKTMKNTR